MESRKKKVWDKPKLIILDFKKTYGGPNAPPTYEGASYHS